MKLKDPYRDKVEETAVLSYVVAGNELFQEVGNMSEEKVRKWKYTDPKQELNVENEGSQTSKITHSIRR